jgi:peptide/nickel transport system ATP-binding protein
MPPLLEARRVTKIFSGGLLRHRGTVALDDLSLALHDDRPSITAIAGESGSGKTTLARLLLGIIHPTSGTMLYKGRNLHGMARAEWPTFRRDVQAIFQDPFEAFNPFYRVDHVLTTAVTKFRLAASVAEGHALIEHALRQVGLRPEETLGRYPHQLSGGQRQRVMVARAMLIRPRVIIADEPVSMVDASLRATILESLLALNRALGSSIVYITHDLTTAYQVSDRILVLYAGSVAESGDADAVIKRPQHPYTQLLVESIPLARSGSRWGQASARTAARDAPGDAPGGCKFADRCPHVMAVCRMASPPLFHTEERRAVACYLYQDAPTAGSS